jgi:hypothetical protein
VELPGDRRGIAALNQGAGRAAVASISLTQPRGGGPADEIR